MGDALVPNSVGLVALFTPLLKNKSYIIYKQIRKKLSRIFYNLPYNLREAVQNPKLMKIYLHQKFKKKSIFDLMPAVKQAKFIANTANNYLLSEESKNKIKEGIDLVATSISKMFTLMFVFLNIFEIYGENKEKFS